MQEVYRVVYKVGERVVAGYSLAQILCYENWIEGVT